MFSCDVSAKELISELKNEVDIAVPISDASYVHWLNSLEQLLYTEIIQEQCEYFLREPRLSLSLSAIDTNLRFEDIYAVYADGVQLMKTTEASGDIFKNTYFKSRDNLVINCGENEPEKLRVIYFVKPAPKTLDEGGNAKSDELIAMPIEFLELVKDKLRGEAYKVANEDALAAKWLNEYNVLLETFKAWISNKAPQFGV